MLPIVASLQCGYGMAGEPYIYVGEHSVPKSYVKKYGKELVLNYAVGKSMMPTIRPVAVSRYSQLFETLCIL